ncbi:unnamed protein product [Chrysodeixis includens]|uniref:Uncharacterized protein n=1 Tax=Chrysodeixis includens TaxID=689277 RepID=A0A9P0BTD7_CHRIL|nr:unnamed protein product [Chrysodeixis includens]
MFTMYSLLAFVLHSTIFVITDGRIIMGRTVLNESNKGLVENFAIPAELHERDGKRFASFGSTVPIHCCTPEQVAEFANKTHHYCDVFTEQVLAPLGELVYVRIDENTAEKVFINRSKRILLVSSDGVLAQWRSAPTFESSNRYIAGAPIVNKDGDLVSVVTARKGNHYAVSTFEGEGGYFETPQPWKILDTPEGSAVYGERWFPSRAEVRAYQQSLPAVTVSGTDPAQPVLHRGHSPRLVLVDAHGRQLSHHYLHGVAANDIEYL